MSQKTDELGQPIGFAVPNWSTRPRPPRTTMLGHFCQLEPIDVEQHAASLHAANQLDSEGKTGPISHMAHSKL